MTKKELSPRGSFRVVKGGGFGRFCPQAPVTLCVKKDN